MFKRLLAALAMSLTLITGMSAQDAVSGKEKKDIIESLTSGYKNWNRASWSGKLSADILPVSATLKVYMERGKLTLISVRVPFFGEVARVEADTEEILIVNKIKKRYYRRSLTEISKAAPDFAEDLQSLLLGRMFVIGEGQLNKRYADQVSVFPAEREGYYMIVPDIPDYLPQTLYGFASDPEKRLSTFVCAFGRADSSSQEALDPDFQYEPKMQAQADVEYFDRGASAQLQALFKGKSYSGVLEVDEIEWGAKGFSRINVDGYKSVSLHDVLRLR